MKTRKPEIGEAVSFLMKMKKYPSYQKECINFWKKIGVDVELVKSGYQKLTKKDRK